MEMVMRRVGVFAFLIVCLAAASPATAQEQEPAAHPIVPADDDQSRPQLPPGAKKTGGFGSVLSAPFRGLGGAMKSGAVWYEENCGGVSGGVAAASTAACFPPWLSVHFGSVGTRSGFLGGGLGFHYNQYGRTGLKFGVAGAATAKQYYLGNAYIGWNNPLEMPSLRVTGYYDFDAQNDFWGFGPNSDEDDLTDYAWERFGADAVFAVPPRKGVWGDVGVRYEKSFVFEGKNDKEPDTVDEFSDLAGVGGPQQELWGPHVSVVIDITDAPGQPTRGIKLKGRAAGYRSVNDLDFDWNQYGAEAEAHIPLAGPWHILSGLIGFEEVEPDGDSEIPFQYLPTLGGSRRLRGFDSWRFRDRAVAFATAAYRYRIWVNQGQEPDDNRNGSFETVIFVDWGTVDDDLDSIDLDDMETAYGFEFRVYFANRHALGIGLAGSDEGPRFNIAMEDVW
jgi:outer membrane protein assembly factor BamA